MNIRFAFVAVASLMLVACGGTQQDPQTEQPATQEQHLDESDAGTGEACGSTICATGYRCCDPKCGICTPIDGGVCPAIGCGVQPPL